MDILNWALTIGEYLWKLVALFAPLALIGFLLYRLTLGVTHHWSKAIGLIAGLACVVLSVPIRSGLTLQEAFARAQVDRLHMQLPWRTVTATNSAYSVDLFDHKTFWQEEYYTFWSSVVNPLKLPLGRILGEVATLPNRNGAIVLWVLGVCVAIGIFLGRTRLAAAIASMLLSFLLGFYLISLLLWAPALCGIVLAMSCITLFIAAGPAAPAVVVRIIW